MSGLAVIVLAAGRGTRMKSALPKVLHPVCGRPMAAYVLDAARSLQPDRIIVVVGYGAEQVRQAVAAPDVRFVEQHDQLGTGHAVQLCREAASGCTEVMVLNGDSPLISHETLLGVQAARGGSPIALATCIVPDMGRFGRVERLRAGAVTGIREGVHESAGTAERNAGQYLFDGPWLWSHIDRLTPSESGELYLTDLPAIAFSEGTPAVTFAGPVEELMGFDDRIGLAEAERLMRQRILHRHMTNGVTIIDPACTYIDATVSIAEDATILPNTHIQGASEIARGAIIGPNAVLRSATIGANTTIGPSVVEDSTVGANVTIGPFCHIRGNSVIGDDCTLGNYAEINRSRLGRAVKMHHFSYLGDATVGDRANIAAGVITNNYDGVNKHQTVIGEDAFVGCDTMLVAPVEMGPNSQTGAGTVLRQDLPANAVAVGVPARIIRYRGE